MTKFQVILLSFFGFFIVLAVIVFAFYKGGGAGSVSATVTIWGDIANEDFNLFLNNTTKVRNQQLTLRYVEKSAATLDQEFTEALAVGKGPDIIILTQNKLWKNINKIIPIPYSSISKRDFQRTFVEE